MVLDLVVSMLSIAAWGIGIYCNPTCSNYFSGCLEPSNDLILEEATANVVAIQGLIPTIDDAILCELYCFGKDEALPRAVMIENDGRWTSESCTDECDSAIPTVMRLATVNGSAQRQE
jgi:hypothetical protein